MKKIIEGFVKFKYDIHPGMEPLFQRLGSGQHPRALFITCADSRIQPSLLTQTEPGDLFLCRNAGNIVPPYGDMQGGVSATIEYSVMALRVPHIIVCGHTDCGAVRAMLHPEKLERMPVVRSWLNHAEAARRVVMDSDSGRGEEELADLLTYENVLVQITHLSTHPSVASALSRGELSLHGWVYDFLHGRLHVFDGEAGEFIDMTKERAKEFPDATPRLHGRRRTGQESQ